MPTPDLEELLNTARDFPSWKEVDVLRTALRNCYAQADSNGSITADELTATLEIAVKHA